MNGDGFGSPPWGPAEPVPERADTQALPGLGPVSGPGEQSGRSQAGHGTRSNGHQAGTAGPDGAAEPERASSGTGRRGRHGRRAKGEGEGKRRRSFWRELPVLIVVALVLALVVKAFLVQAFWIPSGSMQNTLSINDRVLINKVVYHLRPIHRGDIVVFDGTGSWDFDNPPASKNIFSKGLDERSGRAHV